MDRHSFDDDGSGISCTCNRLKGHPLHVTEATPEPARAPLRAVPDMGVRLAPDQAETSQDAALTAWPRAGSKRADVLEAVAAAGEYGATDDELVFDTDMSANTLRPRRGELVTGGWLEAARNDDGTERTRPSDQGNPSTVWVLTPAAKAREVA